MVEGRQAQRQLLVLAMAMGGARERGLMLSSYVSPVSLVTPRYKLLAILRLSCDCDVRCHCATPPLPLPLLLLLGLASSWVLSCFRPWLWSEAAR